MIGVDYVQEKFLGQGPQDNEVYNISPDSITIEIHRSSFLSPLYTVSLVKSLTYDDSLPSNKPRMNKFRILFGDNTRTLLERTSQSRTRRLAWDKGPRDKSVE